MSDDHTSADRGDASGSDERMSALFAQLIMQQANLAMMLLGKTAHPETGETVKDLDSARLFIDELEMLEVKTKGNLSKEESALLKQSLMSLRLAFVEAVEAPESRSAQPQAAPEKQAAHPSPPQPPEEESHKKFSKKY